jgi:hypothetical protein
MNPRSLVVVGDTMSGTFVFGDRNGTFTFTRIAAKR